MDILEEFRNELTEGEIHFRDNLQFELKSEFSVNPNIKKNAYKQDFYLFIPSGLQINAETYSRIQFYLDETNLIRFKTPQISLVNLIKPDYIDSPLIRLQKSVDSASPIDSNNIIEELKLFGNIFKTALRDRIHLFISKCENHIPDWQKYIEDLYLDIKNTRRTYWTIQTKFKESHPDMKQLIDQWKFTDEFISHTIEYYLTCLLKIIRDSTLENKSEADQQLCELILQEQKYRVKANLISSVPPDNPFSSESLQHRKSLLNQSMLEALFLNINRRSLEEKHGNILAALAAGIAMSFYVVLFAWRSPSFVINSTSLIVLAVILYILKDRIKEGLKTLFYKQAFRWFPDYSSEIKNQKGRTIGRLNETFSFIDETQVPPEFLKVRDHEFREELPELKRQETILHYKREVILYQPPKKIRGRRTAITTFFRFNIHRFLQKANNPMQDNLVLNPVTLELTERLLPRVYHINIIIQNTYIKSNLKEKKGELKKFRVVMDKFGIKRVEQIKELKYALS